MISKELITQVLNLKRVDEIYVEDNLIYFCELNEGINIYELAYKCKEWAYEFGYQLASYPTGEIYMCRDPHNNNVYVSGSSEPEAIFKACQWILDNKD
jgi:hypothetical protein